MDGESVPFFFSFFCGSHDRPQRLSRFFFFFSPFHGLTTRTFLSIPFSPARKTVQALFPFFFSVR